MYVHFDHCFGIQFTNSLPSLSLPLSLSLYFYLFLSLPLSLSLSLFFSLSPSLSFYLPSLSSFFSYNGIKHLKVVEQDGKYGFSVPCNYSSLPDLIVFYSENSLETHNPTLTTTLTFPLNS